MGSSNNTTTTTSNPNTLSVSTTSLPQDVLNGLSTAVGQAVGNSTMANPVAGLAQGVAPWSPAQYNATTAYTMGSAYAPPEVSANYGTPQVSSGYQPQQVQAGSVTQYGSPYVSGQQIQNYMNPYTSSVIGTSLDELNRQLAKTNQASDGQAASAGAFGGDRAAIVNSENTRNANQVAAQTIAGLNSQNYSQATQQAQQDASRALQAGTSQAQLGANVGESNQYAGLQGANLDATQQRANQSAALSTDALNATQQRSNQSADVNAQNLRLQSDSGLMSAGQNYQNTIQNLLNSQYSQQYRDAMWPITSTQTLASEIGTLAGVAPRTTTTDNTGTSSSSTTSPGTSTLGQITGVGTALAGLNSLTGNSISSGIKSLFSGDGSSSSGSTYDPTSSGATSGLLSDGSLSTGAQDLSSLGFYSPLDSARGGLIGYADGGSVNDGGDDTYVPVDDASVGGLTPQQRIALYQQFQAQQQPQVNPQGDYQGYTPDTTGNYQTNVGGLAGNGPASSAVDQALAVNPASYITQGQPATDDGTPVSQDDPATLDVAGSAALAQPGLGSPVPQNGGLGAAAHAPSAPPSGGLGGMAPQPDTGAPSFGGLTGVTPQPQTRIQQSANPGNPLPGNVGGQSQQDPNDWQHNRIGMALLAAGLGMMSSKSHTALGAIGDGGLAGLQQLQGMTKEQNQHDLAVSQMQANNAYRQGMLGVQGQRNNNQGARVAGQVQHWDNQDQNVTQRISQNQPLIDARIQALYAQAQKNATSVSPAQLQEQVISGLQAENPGMSLADAYAQVRNYTARNNIAQQSLALRRQQMANQQDWRAFQRQSRATDQEIAGARSIMNNATQLGKSITMEQALNQVRSARSSVGPAPIVGAPQGTQQQGQQQGPAGGVRVSSADEMNNLAPGTVYSADGVNWYRKN